MKKTVEIMFYEKNFKEKPDQSQTIEIQKKLMQTEINIKELAEQMAKGATFKPALLSGTKSSDFISQQLYALDFDGGTAIEDELKRCHELSIFPCFGYTTFSHQESKHKFRLVFCTEDAINDKYIRDRLQQALINAFPNSDSVTKDASRLFYGGRGLINTDYDNLIDADAIINNHYVESEYEKKKYKTSVKPKQDPETNPQGDIINLHIDAIKKLDIIEMRRLLGLDSLEVTDRNTFTLLGTHSLGSTIFTSAIDLKTYIYHEISLNEYLNIYHKVNCIIPEHKDTKPSANIFITDNGTPIYKCFGCGKVYTIIGITEKLAGCKRSEAIEFIKAVYGLELQKSEWTEQTVQWMIDNANYLDSGEFNIQFPALSKLIRTRKHHLQKMLIHFTQYVKDDMNVNGNPVFFSNYDTLLNVCGINKNKRNTLAQTLTLFCLLNMLEKVEHEKIPEKELNKAKHFAAQYKLNKLVSFYSFEEYGVNLLEKSEELARELKEKHLSFKGLSREFVYRTFGKDKADSIYPQYKYENNKGLNKSSEENTLLLAKEIFLSIEDKGYCLEKDLKVNNPVEKQWKRSIFDILDCYDLKIVRANKELKNKYGIKSNGYPNIIIKNEDFN